jgi:uncharacterized protein with HEPN domain
MPSKNPAQRLKDIVENLDAIRAFTAGMDKASNPSIDWPAIAAAGNVYRHEYELVDDAWSGIPFNTNWTHCEMRQSRNFDGCKKRRTEEPIGKI